MSYDNLKRWYNRADAHDIKAAKSAYQNYRRTMVDFSKYTMAGLSEVTAAFVALSPNNDYEGNLRSLKSCIKHYNDGKTGLPTVTTYKACAKRAMRYLNREVDFWTTAKGPKIKAFYHSILFPDINGPAVIDGHMVGAYADRDDFTMKDAAAYLTALKYREIDATTQRLADWLKVPTAEVQAQIWFARKRILNVKYSAQMSLDGWVEDDPWNIYRPWHTVATFD